MQNKETNIEIRFRRVINMMYLLNVKIVQRETFAGERVDSNVILIWLARKRQSSARCIADERFAKAANDLAVNFIFSVEGVLGVEDESVFRGE